jgi:WhiB family redox-sensing transcriptional regulator
MYDPDTWFPLSMESSEADLARTLCRNCELQNGCLADAIKNNITYGVWGGTSPQERQVLLRRENAEAIVSRLVATQETENAETRLALGRG